MTNQRNLNKRFWEIDFIRGIALIGMIIYHLFFDLDYFNVLQLNITSYNWFLFAHTVAFSFIFISGISLSLSYSRARLKNKTKLRQKYIKRGIKIFGLGVTITLTTYIFLPNAYIIFGVLHFIGTGIILSIPFLNKKPKKLLYYAFPIILVGITISNITIDTPLLLWLGVRPIGFQTIDYFPIFPWFGVVLLGIATGKTLYPNYKRKIELPKNINNKFIKKTSLLGKNSLIIYFLHQPLIISILLLMGFIQPEFLLIAH
ncbi:hypothetical protein C9439_07365 [archaeon SCG-AAA382B04]|nr:hypothetical protein C9439_07365 [archaeon SCG-AAA382B04]